MPPHPLTNFEIERYYPKEPRFNSAFSRNNFSLKIKVGAYVINLDEYADVSTHWIALFCNKNEIVYFNSFCVEHVPEEIKEFIGIKNIKAHIFRVQANNSVMRGYFCIGFIGFMLAGKKFEIENYFHQEINQRKSCSKKLSKFVTAFGYIDKVLSALMQQMVEYLSFRLRLLLVLLSEQQVQVLL